MEAYQKKQGKILSLADLNPLVITDTVFQEGGTTYVGYTASGQKIPQNYKGGRIPRSLAHQHIGKIDLMRAMEMSSNPYFALLASECLETPETLLKAARLFSYGEKTGVELPGEITGHLPTDLASNKTGLYATAIGQHALVVTPLQTAVMLSTLANGGKKITPTILRRDTPPHGKDIPLPGAIRTCILRGLKAGTRRAYQDHFSSLARLYRTTPDAIRSHQALQEEMLGKTSTSEVVEQIDLDPAGGTNLYTHVWFGAISFVSPALSSPSSAWMIRDEYGVPELVVVVYLKYGGYGKEAAPLAAQIIQYWRSLQQRTERSALAR
jgi:cell division protein FtsI/penicillin-binding protein 2